MEKMKLFLGSEKILNDILDYQCCPFADECSPECPCRVFDNESLSCYQIALNIKKMLEMSAAAIAE